MILIIKFQNSADDEIKLEKEYQEFAAQYLAELNGVPLKPKEDAKK